MSDWAIDGGTDSLGCLLKWSNAPYSHTLPSPPPDGGRSISGWDNVKPNAVYDLRPQAGRDESVSTKKKHESHQLRNKSANIRGALSMPNLCSKFSSRINERPFPVARACYMSGCLDDNYRYVYQEGLSERCRRDIEKVKASQSRDSAMHHEEIRTSLSTCNLTLDPASLSLHPTCSWISLQPRGLHSEYPKFDTAHSPKSEILAEQKSNAVAENGLLRNRTLNSFPSLRLRSKLASDLENTKKLDEKNHNEREAKLQQSLLMSKMPSSQMQPKSHRVNNRIPHGVVQTKSQQKPVTTSTQDQKNHWPSAAYKFQQLTLNTSSTHKEEVSTKYSKFNDSDASAFISNTADRQSNHSRAVVGGSPRRISSSKQRKNKVLHFPVISLNDNRQLKMREPKVNSLNNRVVAYFGQDGVDVHVERVSDRRPIARERGQQPLSHCKRGAALIPYFVAVNTIEQKETLIPKRLKCGLTSIKN